MTNLDAWVDVVEDQVGAVLCRRHGAPGCLKDQLLGSETLHAVRAGRGG